MGKVMKISLLCFQFEENYVLREVSRTPHAGLGLNYFMDQNETPCEGEAAKISTYLPTFCCVNLVCGY